MMSLLLLFLSGAGAGLHTTALAAEPLIPTSTPALKASCSVSGSMLPPSRGKKDGFNSIQGMIRLHYPVETVAQCKAIIEDYCLTRVSEGYAPEELIIKFRDLTLPKHSKISPLQTFRIYKNCDMVPVKAAH